MIWGYHYFWKHPYLCNFLGISFRSFFCTSVALYFWCSAFSGCIPSWNVWFSTKQIPGKEILKTQDSRGVFSRGFLLQIYGCFLKWWYPQNTPKWSFLVGRPILVGYHDFRKPPYNWMVETQIIFYFHPESLGKMIQFDVRIFFQIWLVQPPTI